MTDPNAASGPGDPAESDAAKAQGPGGPEGPDETGFEASREPPPAWSPRPPFPWGRLAYAIGYSILAWIVFWLIVLLLMPLHFIAFAITRKPNEELNHLSLRSVHYLDELLGFITGVRDEKPFPLGPLPKE
jgi:hypothetical protein